MEVVLGVLNEMRIFSRYDLSCLDTYLESGDHVFIAGGGISTVDNSVHKEVYVLESNKMYQGWSKLTDLPQNRAFGFILADLGK